MLDVSQRKQAVLRQVPAAFDGLGKQAHENDDRGCTWVTSCHSAESGLVGSDLWASCNRDGCRAEISRSTVRPLRASPRDGMAQRRA